VSYITVAPNKVLSELGYGLKELPALIIYTSLLVHVFVIPDSTDEECFDEEEPFEYEACSDSP
jgi:hypothetical protein